MARNRLKQYQRLRDEWREIGSILFRQLTRDDLFKAADKLSLNRHGALALREGGMDFESLGDFAVFEVLLADSRRTDEALAALPEMWRSHENDRARLAGLLIESLQSERETGVEAAWLDEVQRRLRELDSGAVKTVPWERLRRAPELPVGIQRRR